MYATPSSTAISVMHTAALVIGCSIALTSGNALAQLSCTGNCAINPGGAVFVGGGGSAGQLSLEGGSVVAAPGGLFAGSFGSGQGTLTISGTGSALNDTNDFTHIGVDGGSATVLLANGGVLSNIGPGVPNPPGSQFFPDGFFYLGTGGDAQLDITSGGRLIFDRLGQAGTASMFIGQGRVAAAGPLVGTANAGSGLVNLSGAGSRLDVSGSTSELFIGFSSVEFGRGEFNIGTGGVASVSASDRASLVVGGGNGAGLGLLEINGSGSLLQVSGGGTTTASLERGGITVLDGGRVEIESTGGGGVFANLGVAFGNREGDGSILVDGSGSVLSFGGANTSLGSIRIGSALLIDGQPAPTVANGSLDIRNGGLVELTANTQPTMFIGFQSDNTGGIARGAANGVMNVSTGGQFITNGELAIGARGAVGVVNVMNGGAIVIDQNGTPVDGDPFASLGIGSTGGTGTLVVGDGGSFLLSDNDPGQLSEVAVGYIAVDGSDSEGLMQVIGSTASFVADASSVRMSVANLGTTASGRVEVLDGGTLSLLAGESASELLIGGEGEAASVLVSGSGSTLSLTGQSDASATISGTSSSLGVFDGGLLDINGTNGSGNLFVGNGGSAAGAFLRGDSLVRVSSAVNLTSGGVVSPGDGPGALGTLTIDGDFSVATGGILEIDALENGNSDLLSITGTATLNGGTVRAVTPDSDFLVERDYTILTATGGVNGEFDDVASSLSYLTPSLSYTADSVILNLIREGAEVQQDVLEATGSQELSITTRTATTVVSNQIANVLSNSLGFGVGNGSASGSGSSAYLPGSFNTGLSAGDDVSSANVWLNFTPSFYETDTILPGSTNPQAVDGRAYTLMVGADKAFSERLVAGVILGAESTDLEFGAISGGQENDGLMLGSYAGFLFNDFVYAGINANYTWLDNDIEESAFGSSSLIRGQFNSERYQLAADLNLVKVVDDYDFRWQLGLSFMEETADKYQTTLGDTAQPFDQRLGRLRLGFTARYAGEKHRPYISVAYENDFDSAVDLEDQNGFVTYLGLRSQMLKDRLFLDAFVSAILGRENQRHNMLGLNLTYLL